MRKILDKIKLLSLCMVLVFALSACDEAVQVDSSNDDISITEDKEVLTDTHSVLLGNETTLDEELSVDLEVSVDLEPEVSVEPQPSVDNEPIVKEEINQSQTETSFDLSKVPAYSGEAFYILNDNEPYFTDDEITAVSFEEYSALDSLGRCTLAVASVGVDIMPTEDRGSISSVLPTGWESVTYDIVSGGYLYNRCHLIGFQLTGENANKENLITGTRYLNVDGMLPFENMIADYVTETENHVYYRVTPIFEGDNLVATGVLMEAKSVEDDGEGILFNVFCYNVQSGITIDYATGSSFLYGSEVVIVEPETQSQSTEENSYVLNTSSMKIHMASCRYADSISESNREDVTASLYDLYAQGYEGCKVCNPS